MARGLSAVCLLIILVVVAYDVLVIQPFSNQVWVPGVRYFGQGDSLLSNKPWVVLIVGALIQTPGNLHHLICWPGTISIYGSISVYITWTDFIGQTHKLTYPCSQDFFSMPSDYGSHFHRCRIACWSQLHCNCACSQKRHIPETDLTRHMAYLTVQLQYRVADDSRIIRAHSRYFRMFTFRHTYDL